MEGRGERAKVADTRAGQMYLPNKRGIFGNSRTIRFRATRWWVRPRSPRQPLERPARRREPALRQGPFEQKKQRGNHERDLIAINAYNTHAQFLTLKKKNHPQLG